MSKGYSGCYSKEGTGHLIAQATNRVGKKMHALPRCGLIFPFQMPYFLHWLLSSTLITQLKPPEASEQAAKKVEGAALELPLWLTRLGPCEPKF